MPPIRLFPESINKKLVSKFVFLCKNTIIYINKMSAPIFRNTVLRNVARNKRFYSATPAPPAGGQSGGNGGLVLGLIAAGGAGYYLYQKSQGKIS